MPVPKQAYTGRLMVEPGYSLEHEIAPQTIQLEVQVTKLNGDLESIYRQWHDMLGEIYTYEFGQPTGALGLQAQTQVFALV